MKRIERGPGVVVNGVKMAHPKVPEAVELAMRLEEKPIILDFMPDLMGEQFRVNPVLNKFLFRDSPVGGPDLQLISLYTMESETQLEQGNIVAALEAYKFALAKEIGFAEGMAAFGGHALLSKDEQFALDGFGNKKLVAAITKALEDSGAKVDADAYAMWLDERRGAYNELERAREEYLLDYNCLTHGARLRLFNACLNLGGLENIEHARVIAEGRRVLTMNYPRPRREGPWLTFVEDKVPALLLRVEEAEASQPEEILNTKHIRAHVVRAGMHRDGYTEKEVKDTLKEMGLAN